MFPGNVVCYHQMSCSEGLHKPNIYLALKINTQITLLNTVFVVLSCFPKPLNWGTNLKQTRAQHVVSMLVCQGLSFSLKYLLKKRYNSKTTAFRVMPLVLQLHLVIMSKYSMFGVDTFNTFWVIGYIKNFAWQQRQSSNHKSLTFSLKNRWGSS